MRAWLSDGTSGPAGLRLVEDAPEPDGEVVVEGRAWGVSFPELLLTQGKYQVRPEPPFSPGAEVAGVVVTAQPGTGLQPGDRVVGFDSHGLWRERVAMNRSQVFPLREELSWQQGAALVMNFHTVHFALERRARLRPGERLLVHGAAGGVGTAAVQVGKAMGAHVTAVVSTPAKGEVARAAGADAVLLTDGWRDEVKAAGGVDVVLDPVGGERAVPSLSALRPEGRFLVVGFAEGAIPQLPANRLLLKNVSAVGVGWGAFVAVEPGILAHTAAALDRMIQAGQVRPPVGLALPFAEAPRALEELSGRRAIGKVVLEA